MDESTPIKLVGPDFSDTCLLYRFIPAVMFPKDSNTPYARMFHPESDGISTDWNKYSTAEETLIRVGLTFKTKKDKTQSDTYKDHESFRVVYLNVGAIRSIEQIEGIEHTPINNAPEIKGFPNNLSHSSVFYSDEEIRLKLAGFCKEVTTLNRSYIKDYVDRRRKELA